MRSRRGWIVILGPPVVLAAVIGTSWAWRGMAAARMPQEGLTIAACADPATSPGPVGGRGSGAVVAPGTWWSRDPRIDAGGGLAGWSLVVGRPGTATMRQDLPASAMISGPDNGRVVATTDDGSTSALRVFDAAARCQRIVPMAGVIPRRAVLVPGRGDALVHLLDRASRRDLGVWRVPLDGSSRSLVMAPVTDAERRAAGIERVWVTDLVLASDGGSMAVQSCDPDACLTRVLDLRRGGVTLLVGSQGGLVGIDHRTLIAHGRCTGEPCGLLAWDLDTGRPTTLVTGAFGAALTGDGRVVVGVESGDGGIDAVVIDLAGGSRRSLGRLESGAEPGTESGGAGIETRPGAIALTRSDGTTTTLDIEPPPAPVSEEQP